MIANWIRSPTERFSIPPIPFEIPSAESFGPGIQNQPSHDALLKETIGIMDACTRAIANRVATLNFVVKRKQTPGYGKLPEEIVHSHPLKTLLDTPHPDLSRYQFMRLTGQWLAIVGEAYFVKVGSGFRAPVELHPAPPRQIEPLVDNNVIVGYLVTDGDGRQDVRPRDAFVRMFFPDPENLWGAEGIVGPASITMDTTKFAKQHLRSKYQHDATPTTVIEATEHAEQFTPETRARFYTNWRDQYQTRTGARAGLPAILPTGYKIVELAMQSGKDITPLLEHLRDDLLMASGVPRSILGQVISGDRSSAETNAFVFDLHTVKPYAELISSTLTMQLARDFDPDLVVRFDEFVAEDKVHRLAQEQSDLDRKVRNINEVRIDHSMPASDWGDEPIATTGEVPYNPEEARKRLEASGDQGPDNGRPDGDEEDPMTPDDVDRAERAEHLRIRKRFRRLRHQSRGGQ